jgi:hypothetical protein
VMEKFNRAAHLGVVARAVKDAVFPRSASGMR